MAKCRPDERIYVKATRSLVKRPQRSVVEAPWFPLPSYSTVIPILCYMSGCLVTGSVMGRVRARPVYRVLISRGFWSTSMIASTVSMAAFSIGSMTISGPWSTPPQKLMRHSQYCSNLLRVLSSGARAGKLRLDRSTTCIVSRS